jgi:integrase
MRTVWIRNETVVAIKRVIKAGTGSDYIIKSYRLQQFATEVERYRNKELKWHHIDFKKWEIMLWVGKQGSAARRKRAPLHPEVVKIFAKWKDVDNLERPIPHAYIWIWKKMKEVKQITGLNFKNHDLRRLKAQLTEKKTHGAKAAAYSIGDKSVEMVKGHYAPTSMYTLRHLNEEAFSQLTKELEGNA